MQKNLRDIGLLARYIGTRFMRDRCSQTAASLTFTTLLSLVPLITIMLTVFSAFPAFENFSTPIKLYLLHNLMPETAGLVITNYMQQFTESAARLTTVGIIFLAVTAMFMMLTIDKSFNLIWQVSRPRPLIKRLVIYWAVLTLAPLLVGASLSLTSWVVKISMGDARHIPISIAIALKVLPVIFATMAFTLMFRLVPNRYVPRLHALIGALIAAILFESMSLVFGYFISHFPTYRLVYGAFASVPIFLIWIYMSWMIILFGAVISASLSHWRTPAAQHLSTAMQLLDALRLLKVMAKYLEQGRVGTLPRLSRTLNLGYDVLERLFEKLVIANMVRKLEGNGWVLIRDASHIRAYEVWRLFVLDCERLPGNNEHEPLQKWVIFKASQIEQAADVSLQELFVLEVQ